MLHWLYPMTCRLCGEAATTALCPDCLAKLPRVPRPICLYCGAPVAGDLADAYHCHACKSKPRPFELARSALLTADSTMPLIHELKYKGASYLGAALTPALAELWQATPELAAYKQAAIVPVPLSRLHTQRRGYNQAEELAAPLAKKLGLPLAYPLQRMDTQADSQTRLSAAERLRNARLAYKPKPEYANGKKQLPEYVVLVDDVYTTGATVRACAAALKSLPGVKHVAVLTLLRVEKH